MTEVFIIDTRKQLGDAITTSVKTRSLVTFLQPLCLAEQFRDSLITFAKWVEAQLAEFPYPSGGRQMIFIAAMRACFLSLAGITCQGA